MFSPPRVLCCSNSLLEERESELSSAEMFPVGCLDVVPLDVWADGLMEECDEKQLNSAYLTLVETVVMVSPPFQAASFWRIHKNSVCLFSFFGQHGPKIMEGKKYTNTKKKKNSNHKQQQTYYSNTKKCRKLLFCLFIWKCLPFLRMLISKLI